MADEEIMSFLDLHSDPEMARRMDMFNTRLNANPPPKWVKKNQFANNAEYLPIDKSEQLLDSIFQDWQIEVLREGTMFNSVYVTVRVHYWHPVKNDWRFHDGVGAHNMQKDSQTDDDGRPIKSVLSMETIKDAAVKMALPIAKSEAIKDACDHLGKLFGRDLNRKNTIDFKPAYMNGKEKPVPDKSDNRLMIMIYNAPDKKSLQKLQKELVTPEQVEAYDEQWSKLK